MPDEELLKKGEPTNLDEAIRLFRFYINGRGGFDELDFKEYINDIHLHNIYESGKRDVANSALQLLNLPEDAKKWLRHQLKEEMVD